MFQVELTQHNGTIYAHIKPASEEENDLKMNIFILYLSIDSTFNPVYHNYSSCILYFHILFVFVWFLYLCIQKVFFAGLLFLVSFLPLFIFLFITSYLFDILLSDVTDGMHNYHRKQQCTESHFLQSENDK